MSKEIINFPHFATLASGDHIPFQRSAGGAGSTKRILYSELITNLVTGLAAYYQPLDAELSAIAGLTSAADRLPYFTGSGTAALATFTSFARTLLDDADAATARSTLGLIIGTNVQAYDAELAALAGLTSAANKLPLFTGSGTAGLLDFDTDALLAGNSNTAVPSQAAIKSYVDNLVTGLNWKTAVACATTANITLSGEQTIDGVLTSGSRVLVKNQSTGSQNGIYVSAAGAWSRSTDADTGLELVGAAVLVSGGSAQANTQWTCSNTAITLGVTSVTFAQIGGAGTYTADEATLHLAGNQFSILDAELLAIAGLTSAADRLAYFTGSGTAALATFTSFGRSLVDDSDATAARVTLGVDPIGTASSFFKFTGIISPTALAAHQEDWNPTGLATAAMIRISASAAYQLRGLDGGADGRILLLHNVGSFTVTLKDEAGTSTAAMRFALTADFDLAADGVALLQYDDTSDRWRVIGGGGGGGFTFTGTPAQGDILYYNGSAWVLLTAGTAGYVLKTNGAGQNPSWASVTLLGLTDEVLARLNLAIQ